MPGPVSHVLTEDHARGPEFLNLRLTRTIEWCRLPGDVVFITAGVIPAATRGTAIGTRRKTGILTRT